MIDVIEFTLPYALPSLNVLLGKHPMARYQAKKKLADEVGKMLLGKMPSSTFVRAHITIERQARSGGLDYDNLVPTGKLLLDILQPWAPRRKFGLGIIYSDAPNYLSVDYRQLRGPPQTTVTIRRAS